MVDTLALGASAVRRNGSSPFEGTKITCRIDLPIGRRDRLPRCEWPSGLGACLWRMFTQVRILSHTRSSTYSSNSIEVLTIAPVKQSSFQLDYFVK